ncbi:MAG: hypothetical protein AB7G87_01195 [Clostridia bacterium]
MCDVKVKKAIANAKASLAIEGLDVPEDVVLKIEMNLSGKLSDKEMANYIMKRGSGEND